MKKILLIVAAIFAFPPVSGPAFCLEQEIVLGKADNWNDFVSFSRIVKKEGKWGTLDLFLADAEYTVTHTTDLLAHFNRENDGDESGNYTLSAKKSLIMKKESVFGEGCALFEKDRYPVFFKPARTSLFYPGKLWGDFTMQFWLNPAALSDSEEILSWSGSRLQGKKIMNQSISCIISRRVCKWVFRNFFFSEADTAANAPGREKLHEIELKGITQLLPRKWHHHMIRFDSETGMLEYLVDNVPESIAHITDDENGSLSVLLPLIGNVSSSDIVIGRYFSGFMDEFMLSAEYIEEPALTRYSEAAGTGLSKVFDTKYTGSLVKKINAVYARPQATDIYFYYRTADFPYLDNDLGTDWIQFIPGNESGDALRGRYIQVKVELFADGTGMVSPALSCLTIFYEPDLPPLPPADLVAIAGDKKVTLYWKKVNQADVAGYEIYYGNRPGVYNGKGSLEGDSPLNAGNVTRFEITGLQNGKIYYFAIAAYDTAGIPHRSVFSVEVNARPNILSGAESTQ